MGYLLYYTASCLNSGESCLHYREKAKHATGSKVAAAVTVAGSKGKVIHA